MFFFFLALVDLIIRNDVFESKQIPWEEISKTLIQSNTIPVDDWQIRNHALLDNYMQDTSSSWIIIWGDEQTERALKNKHPNLRKLKKSFLNFVKNEKNIYRKLCSYSPTTIGLGDPNNPIFETTFRIWSTNFENWCPDGVIKEETWDEIRVIELCNLKWKKSSTTALIFCIC